ncbi:MAG: GIY-YIG nuclease family protein [Janthinobacterium lividum]
MPERLLVYVGEADQVKTRLAAHDSDETKDFFTRAVLIISKDENLTKAHGRYLDGRIISAIHSAGRAKLTNSTQPPFKGLPEPEIADMERILDEVKILLPVLGFDLLRPAGQEVRNHLSTKEGPSSLSLSERVAAFPLAGSPSGIEIDQEPIFFAIIKKAKAHATERAGEFVVLAGSTAYSEHQESQSFPLRNLRQVLQESEVLVPHQDPNLLLFTQNVSFGSPSAASSFIGGYSDSGPRTWKLERTGESYREWRKRKMATVA